MQPSTASEERSAVAAVFVDDLTFRAWYKRSLPLVQSYSDPEHDGAPMAVPVVDLVEVEVHDCHWSPPSVCVFLDPATVPQPGTDPHDQWIAYGIVVDNTGDGRAAQRFGIDNACCDSTAWESRMWRTDLANGATQAYTDTLEAPHVMDATYPGTEDSIGTGLSGRAGHIFAYSREDVFRFYVWASVIRNGEIVSTDYAPDFGWFATGVR